MSGFPRSIRAASSSSAAGPLSTFVPALAAPELPVSVRTVSAGPASGVPCQHEPLQRQLWQQAARSQFSPQFSPLQQSDSSLTAVREERQARGDQQPRMARSPFSQPASSQGDVSTGEDTSGGGSRSQQQHQQHQHSREGCLPVGQTVSQPETGAAGSPAVPSHSSGGSRPGVGRPGVDTTTVHSGSSCGQQLPWVPPPVLHSQLSPASAQLAALRALSSEVLQHGASSDDHAAAPPPA